MASQWRTVPLPRYTLLLTLTIVTFSSTAQASVRSTGQFLLYLTDFYPYLKEGNVDQVCASEAAKYHNASIPDPPGQGHHLAWNYVNCILQSLLEVTKAEMAVTGILLGLLPATLSQIGPSLAETALLSMRRPVLAFFLEMGTPAPNPTAGEFSEPLESLRKGTFAVGSIPWLREAPFLVKALFSAFEYAVAFGATANCTYQVWVLTYRAVSLAPISVLIPNVPETAILFFWILVLIPNHAFSVTSFQLNYRQTQQDDQDLSQTPKRNYPIRRLGTKLRQAFIDEITPCCYGRPLNLEERDHKVLSALFASLAFFISCLHVVLGTVLLGSVLFVTLADVLPLVESIVILAMASRLVVLFELQGLCSVSANTGSDGSTAGPTLVGSNEYTSGGLVQEEKGVQSKAVGSVGHTRIGSTPYTSADHITVLGASEQEKRAIRSSITY